jgi:membrane-associated protein
VDFSALLDYSALQDLLLGYVADYTYPVLALMVLLGAIGLPLPVSLIILTAGALASQGNASLTAVIAITAVFATIGDSICFALGLSIMRHMDRFPFMSQDKIRKGSVFFSKHVEASIFLSRFLFTTLGTPVNVLSAVHNIGYRRFIAPVALGELAWGAELGVIGYLVGPFVEELFSLINNVGVVLALLLATAWLIRR